MNRGRTVLGSKPITLQMGRSSEVRLVGRAAGQDPLVAGDDVGVRPDDGAHPPVQVQPEGVLLRRQLAMEVDEPNGGSGSDDSSRSASASVNGFSIGCMYVRPWRFITARSVPSRAWYTPQPRPGTPRVP